VSFPAALYGADAFLGVINLVTHRPEQTGGGDIVVGGKPPGRFESGSGARSRARLRGRSRWTVVLRIACPSVLASGHGQITLPPFEDAVPGEG
jgi:hypothetical protein